MPAVNSTEFDLRELRPSEKKELLSFRNSIFGDISEEKWDAMGCTAAMAWKDNELWGAIPLQFRQQVIAPGITIPVVYENAVGVSDKARGTGIGTKMIDNTSQFIQDRTDALFVYRGSERSDGYRFYRKTHHGDLFFQQLFTLQKPKGRQGKVHICNADQALERESELMALFGRCYKRFGGYWKRQPGYFKTVLSSHVYKNDNWRLFIYAPSKKLEAYAIVNPECKHAKGYNIYDYAARSETALAHVLDAIAYDAAQESHAPGVFISPENPFYQFFVKYGFAFERDEPYIMARMLNCGNLFAASSRGSALLRNLELRACTPHRDCVLNQPKKPAYCATLYLKEAQLSRLLCRRLDFGQAVRQNMVRTTWLPEKYLKALSQTFTFAPWVSFSIDYV
ncbi:MAG: hypothetical protein A2487_06420 [Candidatus Raymondbacteria bacterium RifOxyC12_full_50_8]|uniref:N-acetyltransferase domain-containing protein n=1 Tax=Candidatus Raymondbacteria bacterium RIFOXYD12_FULL_49_13 TaxID=1817890 RepID=A0A1F7FHT8_UNCRA|nr:MAG: hypothetical protein A2248_21135 [Candidatus Raymondbacteria bacterium RIFOXYA2_FULL_49_16]OGJ95702.1 MAG: hypothetical protein A2350_12235 [Candidatus Raymondbacteria bacterium RifOxyB12_full_50_8]OGK05936.1 MAG: hypothetical protein A2487_06420 [Candidatus Raymondbacteria bacterium RifOxyC12_full_50_8]OGK06294.1 MAG: hypothetical protein A2519_08450 [Candidatus Raymondbacteria bacterium RIFOXYD12_FULL_49_13]OGP40626.1 MAG: hypothetical protein A2324_03205 [Candidatus Raymondbacteria b